MCVNAEQEDEREYVIVGPGGIPPIVRPGRVQQRPLPLGVILSHGPQTMKRGSTQ